MKDLAVRVLYFESCPNGHAAFGLVKSGGGGRRHINDRSYPMSSRTYRSNGELSGLRHRKLI